MITTTAIILSHYKEREDNLPRIIEDLRNGSVVPEKIIVICDNPDIVIDASDIQIIRISESVLPIVRFAIGSMQETTHCLFIDDDLTVGVDTLKKFTQFAKYYPKYILGFEGNINGKEYTDGETVNMGKKKREVDIIIRLYFVPTDKLSFALQLRAWHPTLPKKSLDDIFLCLGNKYICNGKNIVIPSSRSSIPLNLPDGRVGQNFNPEHYVNRNLVCRFLKNRYE